MPSNPAGKVVKVRVSHYNPALGGVNCAYFAGGECLSHMASGLPWQSHLDKAAACVPEWPFHTRFTLDGHTWECLDRGSAIVTVDGIPWVDLLEEHASYPFGSIHEVILEEK